MPVPIARQSGVPSLRYLVGVTKHAPMEDVHISQIDSTHQDENKLRTNDADHSIDEIGIGVPIKLPRVLAFRYRMQIIKKYISEDDSD